MKRDCFAKHITSHFFYIRLFSPDLTRHAIATSASLGDGDIYCTYAKKDEVEVEIKEAEAKIFTLKNGDVSENNG